MVIFNKIINLYREIKELYQELFDLEMQGKMEDVSFLTLINKLEIKLKKEYELLEKFVDVCGNNYDMVYSVINKNIDEYGKEFRLRIIDQMMMYEHLNFRIDDDLEEEERIEQELVFKLDKLYMACCRDLYLVYYSFLQDYIDSEAFLKYSKKLLEIKYNSAFVDTDMESQLVKSKCNARKVSFVSLYFVIQALEMDSQLCDGVIVDTYLERIDALITELLSMKDYDYEDVEKVAVLISNQCMIRAGLSLLSDSDYDKAISIINEKIKMSVMKDNRISVMIIASIINERKKDKSRVRKISLKPMGN